MSILSRLRRSIRGRPAPDEPASLADGKGRVHLLAGDFRNEAEARAYCYDAALNQPEQLTRDQPGAFIDTAHVEVDFGDHIARLTEIFTPPVATDLIEQIDGQNTLIIIAEPAFGSLPYRLADTDMLSYLGPQIVDI